MSAISTKIYAKDSSGTLRELQPETTISNVSGLQTALDGKVNTVSGKGLSTNDYTTAEKNKLSGIEANANNYVHPTTSGNKHIPSGGSSGKVLGWSADGTAAWVDPTVGGGSVETVFIGSSEYAPDASGKVTLPNYPTTLPASDVYSWAKASSKPTYTASDVGLGNVGNFKAVSTVASQGLSATEKSNARTNIGAGTGTVTGVKVGSTSYSPSSGVVSLPAYPTSLPASDVYSWAKASSKPSYTYSEVGAASEWTKTNVGFSASNYGVYQYTGLSITVPKYQVFMITAVDLFSNASPEGILIATSSSSLSGSVLIGKSESDSSSANSHYARSVVAITPKLDNQKTYYIWVKRGNTGSNQVRLFTQRIE